MTGFRLSTVSTIVQEVCEAIVKNLWAECVTHHFPKDEAEFKEKMLDFEELHPAYMKSCLLNPDKYYGEPYMQVSLFSNTLGYFHTFLTGSSIDPSAAHRHPQLPF